ncbi:DUF3050 domain-containing protein [Hazenella coriacea]|uniref:DUF3050 family protein n=1 Tax=Hazenella coriacea TaxID=1179467 RepID=A0A4R3L811_9BACL|nr:DUF3050 domain-containing protein [Hazenella coriacea]TCS95933.1 DUF3050 family protein [Hazenella coriacea]
MSDLTFKQMESIRDQLLDHPVYSLMNTPDRVRIFMKHHSFAVWDFMSLLKKLQQTLTCVTVPWIPQAEPNYARFINEIVIGEETDEDGEGGYISHFELYLQAMNEVDADTKPIESLITLIQEGEDPISALNQIDMTDTVKEFVSFHIELATSGQPHEIASAFFYGREDLIPDMFTVLIKEMKQNKTDTNRLHYYLQRHIELDGDEHGPLAKQLLLYLCKEEEQKLIEADQIAKKALQARIRLWDGVIAEINEKGL